MKSTEPRNFPVSCHKFIIMQQTSQNASHSVWKTNITQIETSATEGHVCSNNFSDPEWFTDYRLKCCGNKTRPRSADNFDRWAAARLRSGDLGPARTVCYYSAALCEQSLDCWEPYTAGVTRPTLKFDSVYVTQIEGRCYLCRRFRGT